MENKVYRGQVEEDRFTGGIEAQTSQIPSSTYLAARGASSGFPAGRAT
jgi:hypothetical protein